MSFFFTALLSNDAHLFDGKTACVIAAITTYMLSLTTDEPFTTFLYDPLSAKYRQLEFQTRNAVRAVILS